MAFFDQIHSDEQIKKLKRKKAASSDAAFLNLAPPAGLEPATCGLTAVALPTELRRNCFA